MNNAFSKPGDRTPHFNAYMRTGGAQVLPVPLGCTVQEVMSLDCPDLGEVEAVPVGRQVMSAVFRSISRKDGSRSYCKFANGENHIRNLFREAGSLIIARKAGLPVPELLGVGRSFAFIRISEMEGETYASVESGLDLQEVKEAGRATGRFCVGVAEAFERTKGKYRPEPQDERQQLDDTANLPDLTGDLIVGAVGWLERRTDFPAQDVETGLRELVAYQGRWRQAKKVMCHTDIQHGNIIMKGKAVSGFIDFGEMEWERMERQAYYLETRVFQGTGGVYEALMELTSPLVTDTMRRDLFAYRLCADIDRGMPSSRVGATLRELAEACGEIDRKNVLSSSPPACTSRVGMGGPG